MNLTKVIQKSQFSLEEMSTAFNDLVKKYMPTIKRAVHFALYIPDNEDLEDYNQEALIYCWNGFQQYYNGPVAPAYSTGEPSTWEDWFFSYAKFGAKNYFRKIHPKKVLKVKCFNEMPDWFEPFDKSEDYDFDLENRIQKMEAIIERQPAKISVKLKSFLKADLKYTLSCQDLELPYNNVGTDQIKWAVAVLKHKLFMETDFAFFHRMQNITFLEAVKYASDMIVSFSLTAKVAARVPIVSKFICAAISAVGLDMVKAKDITVSELITLLAELRKDEYKPKDYPIVFKRRLTDLLEWFRDLDISDGNVLKGTRIDIVSGRSGAKPRSAVKPTIRRVRNFNTLTQKHERAIGYSQRPINCLSLSGEIIKTYDSAKMAAREGFNYNSIQDVLKGVFKAHKGYLWVYADGLPYSRVRCIPTNAKPIIATSKTGESMFFASGAEAVKAGFFKGHVNKALSGTLKSYKGYYWSYATEKNLTAINNSSSKTLQHA